MLQHMTQDATYDLSVAANDLSITTFISSESNRLVIYCNILLNYWIASIKYRTKLEVESNR